MSSSTSSKSVGNPTCGIDVWAPPELSVFTGISCLLIAVIATSGNGLIITAIIIDPLKRLRTPFNYLIVNLAAADLVMGCICMPLSFYVHYQEYKVKLDPLANNTLRMSYFISGMASIISLIALSLDRYFAISRAISYRMFFSWRKCAAVTVVIWSTSVVFPFLYFQIGAVNYYFLFACAAILTGFFVLLVASFQIQKLLRQQTQLMSSQMPDSSSERFKMKRLKQEKKITRIFLILLICFVAIYFPAVVMVFVLYFWKSSDCVTRHVLRDLQSVLISFNSCINPFIYIVRLKAFQLSIKRILPCFSRSVSDSINSTATQLSDKSKVNRRTVNGALEDEHQEPPSKKISPFILDDGVTCQR